MGATATDRRLLFAMTGPADISIPFSSNLKDGSKVQGFANLRVQIRDDDIPKLLNMFANSARSGSLIPLFQGDGNFAMLSQYGFKAFFSHCREGAHPP